jgi:hypothetical protein
MMGDTVVGFHKGKMNPLRRVKNNSACIEF